MRLILLALPLATLAACSSQPVVHAENASMAEVAAKAQGAMKIEPGEWRSKTELLAFDMPGMKDPAMGNMIRESMKKQQAKEMTYCVTKAEAEKPTADLFAGKGNGDCRFETFNMAGGTLSAKMTCKGKDSPGSMTMAMAGTYTSTAYDMTMDMNASNPMGGQGGMTMKAKTSAQRIGACKPGEE